MQVVRMVWLENNGTPTRTELLVGYRHAESAARKFRVAMTSSGAASQVQSAHCVVEVKE